MLRSVLLKQSRQPSPTSPCPTPTPAIAINPIPAPHLPLQLAERDSALRALLAQNAELKASHERALKAQTGSFRAELDKMGSSHAEMVEVVENENAAAKQKVV